MRSKLNSSENNFKFLEQRVQLDLDHDYKLHALGYDVTPSPKDGEISVLAIIRIMDCEQLSTFREWNTPIAAMGIKGYFVSTISAVKRNQNLDIPEAKT